MGKEEKREHKEERKRHNILWAISSTEKTSFDCRAEAGNNECSPVRPRAPVKNWSTGSREPDHDSQKRHKSIRTQGLGQQPPRARTRTACKLSPATEPYIYLTHLLVSEETQLSTQKQTIYHLLRNLFFIESILHSWWMLSRFLTLKVKLFFTCK